MHREIKVRKDRDYHAAQIWRSGRTRDDSQRDLRVYINSKLKWCDQDEIDQASQKAIAFLEMLKLAYLYCNVRLLVKLYTFYVRPHLEYCSSAWNHYRKKDIKSLSRHKNLYENCAILSMSQS